MFGRSTPASEAAAPVVVAQHAALSRDAARDVRMQGDQWLALGAAPHDEKAAVLESAAEARAKLLVGAARQSRQCSQKRRLESSSDCGSARASTPAPEHEEHVYGDEQLRRIRDLPVEQGEKAIGDCRGPGASVKPGEREFARGHAQLSSR